METQTVRYPQNILLAVDGSDHSCASVALLQDLPLPETSRIHALAVLVPREASRYAALEGALNNVRVGFSRKGVHTRTELLPGYPAETLLEQVDRQQPDLLVLGAKGLRATLGILVGGVAQQLVEYAPVPLLIVRAPYKGLQRLLLVTDGSEHSQRALDYLGQFALPASAKVEILHVLPPVPSPDLVIRAWPVGGELTPPLPTPEMEAAALEQAAGEEDTGRIILEAAIERLKAYSKHAEGVLKRGDAATEIIDYIKKREIDLVVAGSRGLSRVRGWLLGSVTRKLVHYSGCSVMIVKEGN